MESEDSSDGSPYILYGALEHVLRMNVRVGLFQHFFYFLQQLLPWNSVEIMKGYPVWFILDKYKQMI